MMHKSDNNNECRLLIIGGKVFRPDKCRLKAETFERAMMIRCNSPLNEVSESVTVENFEELVKDSDCIKSSRK